MTSIRLTKPQHYAAIRGNNIYVAPRSPSFTANPTLPIQWQECLFLWLNLRLSLCFCRDSICKTNCWTDTTRWRKAFSCNSQSMYLKRRNRRKDSKPIGNGAQSDTPGRAGGLNRDPLKTDSFMSDPRWLYFMNIQQPTTNVQ